MKPLVSAEIRQQVIELQRNQLLSQVVVCHLAPAKPSAP